MTIKKDDALQIIRTDFEKLANIVLQQLDNMESIVNSSDLKVSEEIDNVIRENEKEIDKSEVKISDKIINTIVLHHPFASELRWLMSCYRILINLERIGDRVINITNFLKKIKDPELYYSFSEVLSSTSILSTKMVRKSLLAFTNNDRELAVWTIRNDDVMDEINNKLLKKLVKKADKEPVEKSKKMIISAITIKEMMSNIERIGDYATNIAEAAIYSIEGKDVRHKTDKVEE